MSLSSELISQFVKMTKDDTKKTTETTLYGTAVESNGSIYVQLDGSELLTPVSTTTNVKSGERVTVLIKDHSATITGNISSPAARTEEVVDVTDKVNDVSDQISDFEIIIADKVSTTKFNAVIATIGNLTADNVTIKDRLTASEADIDDLIADNVTIHGTLTANEADIKKLRAEKIDATVVESTYATIEDLDATNATIYNLDATYATIDRLNATKADIDTLLTKKLDAEIASITYATIDSLNATNATIDNLDATFATITQLNAAVADIDTLLADKATIGELNATNAKIDNLDAVYANIDFSNIDKATMEEFYAKSGLIQNVVIGDGTITGNLVGVTIQGDLIEAGTLVANKLVIQGEDGLYYRLNTDGVTVESEQTEYNSLDGSVIIAKSITASKISVKDLVAFGATIGGFHITDSAIYSGVKSSVDNTTVGTYLDDEGQMAFGDLNNYVKFYKEAEDSYKLDIAASSVKFVSSEEGVKDVETEFENATEGIADAANTASDAEARVGAAETTMQMLSDSIAAMVTDENGQSLMTQTSTGWTFNISGIQKALDGALNDVNALNSDVESTDAAVADLQHHVNNLLNTAEYIRIGTYNDEPCIEMGEADSEFKILITNTRIIFYEGLNETTYIRDNTLYTNKISVTSELEQSGFVWKVRSNGNYGLSWKG